MSRFVVGGRDMVHGFDWSQWQFPRDLTNIHATQDFAVFKASEGNSYGDPRYYQHVKEADDAGLCHGAYHFAQPNWAGGSPYNDGRAEARWFLDRIADTERFGVLDLEATSLNAAQTTEYVYGWNDEMWGSGKFPFREQHITYVGKWFTWSHVDQKQAQEKSVLWIPAYTAGYTKNVRPDQIDLPGWSSNLWPEGWKIWQYSSSGTVQGLNPSDVNVATTDWFAVVSGNTSEVVPPQYFEPQHDGGNPNMWVFWWDGAAYRLCDVPVDAQHPDGQAWRWIHDPEALSDLAFTGKINGAMNVTVKDDPQNDWDRAFQDLFNRYPIDVSHRADAIRAGTRTF